MGESSLPFAGPLSTPNAVEPAAHPGFPQSVVNGVSGVAGTVAQWSATVTAIAAPIPGAAAQAPFRLAGDPSLVRDGIGVLIDPSAKSISVLLTDPARGLDHRQRR